MAKLKKIEARTNWFIDAYKKLENNQLLPSNTDLARLMQMNSKSTVTNILNREQNIQPEQWERFRDHFGLADGSEINEPDPTPMQILAVMAEAFKAHARTMENIEKNMARADSQARVEVNLQRVFGGVEAIGEQQDHALKKILEDLAEIKGKIGGLS